MTKNRFDPSMYTLVPFVGFGEVKFGISSFDAVMILGDGFYDGRIIGAGNRESRSRTWKQHRVQLTFSNDHDHRLTLIKVCDRKFTLLGRRWIGKGEEKFLSLIQPMLSDLKAFPRPFGSMDYYSASIGAAFLFEEERVDSLLLYPEYEADDKTIKWPK